MPDSQNDVNKPTSGGSMASGISQNKDNHGRVMKPSL